MGNKESGLILTTGAAVRKLVSFVPSRASEGQVGYIRSLFLTHNEF